MTRMLGALLAICLPAAAIVVAPQAAAASTLSMRGADVSSLQRAIDVGAKYYTAAGVAADPLDILKSAGVNYVRLRVWNNPASGYNNASRVVAYARTVKAKGFKLLVDFHYSDTWADPGKQFKPAAWYRATAGIRPTSPTRATAGTTWRCSTGPASSTARSAGRHRYSRRALPSLTWAASRAASALPIAPSDCQAPSIRVRLCRNWAAPTR